jgi:8-oxo-dGTP pyrophosphatase MutT (NUDIX family)
VVIRRRNGKIDVALAARRTRQGDLAWGLPKGLVEQGESPEEAALREVQEETGLQARAIEPLGDISYWYVWEGERIRKKVTFFLMEATGGDVTLHDHEMEDVRWFPLDDARRKASYPSEKETLHRAALVLARTA